MKYTRTGKIRKNNTYELLRYLEDNYVYAITPPKRKYLHRTLGFKKGYLDDFMVTHKVRLSGINEEYALMLCKEGYLTDDQICNITRTSHRIIKEFRKELNDEKNLES